MSNKIKNIIYIFVMLICFGIIYYNLKSDISPVEYDWYHSKMGLNMRSDRSKGEGVVISVIDTGVNRDLFITSNILEGYNFVNKNTDTTDFVGHGTEIICLLVCEDKVNQVFGISPKVTILPLVVTDSSGNIYIEEIANAILYSIEKDVDIINLSMGSTNDNLSISSAIDEAISNGIIVVAAGGDNGRDELLFPANYQGVIGVMTQSYSGALHEHANKGEGGDIVVPGVDLLTWSKLNGEFIVTRVTGSSYATGLFSGMIALKLSEGGDTITIYEWIIELESTRQTNEFIKLERKKR